MAQPMMNIAQPRSQAGRPNLINIVHISRPRYCKLNGSTAVCQTVCRRSHMLHGVLCSAGSKCRTSNRSCLMPEMHCAAAVQNSTQLQAKRTARSVMTPR